MPLSLHKNLDASQLMANKHAKYRTSPASINTMAFHDLAACENNELHQGGQQSVNIHPDGMSTCPQVRSCPAEGNILRGSTMAV
jgi:hypothetical protein